MDNDITAEMLKAWGACEPDVASADIAASASGYRYRVPLGGLPSGLRDLIRAELDTLKGDDRFGLYAYGIAFVVLAESLRRWNKKKIDTSFEPDDEWAAEPWIQWDPMHVVLGKQPEVRDTVYSREVEAALGGVPTDNMMRWEQYGVSVRLCPDDPMLKNALMPGQ